MKKLTLGIMLGILMIFGASAFFVGQVITQNQLNNQNIDEVGVDDLNCAINNVIQHNITRDYGVNVTCNTIEPLTEGVNYTIVDKQMIVWFDNLEMRQCLNENGRQWCLDNVVNPTVVEEGKEFFRGIKEDLEYYQSLDDFELTSEDIDVRIDDFDSR